jgi:hypothetical protein
MRHLLIFLSRKIFMGTRDVEKEIYVDTKHAKDAVFLAHWKWLIKS